MNDSKQLLVFLDVVDQGSFVNAAKLRNTDPGRVTKQIKNLENQLGAVLLNRSTRSMSLTEVGEKIYAKASQIKTLLDDVSEIPHEYQQKVQGVVRVTSPTFIGRKFVEPAIRTIQQQYPDVVFELEVTDGKSDIIKEGYDVAIRQWQPQDSNLIATKLRDVQLKLVASPEFINIHGGFSSIEELLPLPASLYRRKNHFRDKIQYFNDQQELVTRSLNGYFIVNDADLILNATLAANAYSLVADYMAEDHLKSGDLVELLPDLQLPPENSVYAVYPHRASTKGTKLLIEKLKQALVAE
ncbi:LysR family transcriptional regulator [Vibrio sp. MACH09]|uniref:LysR family transcriptional regulator n=1 Tax=Vibrio sp. MACH09 TaxID=3025122 RepID=UPI002794C2A2|nr:LysR family transcriptional regulator [Vibrio sp. MACH09]GLO60615.1 LysR family transcriptional regulator [Vibrio sp. MACH09]